MDDISNFMISVATTYAESCGVTLECLLTEDAPRSSCIISSSGQESVASLPPPEIVATPHSSFTEDTRSASRQLASYFQCDVSEISSINSSLSLSGGDDTIGETYSMKHNPPMMLEKMAETDLVFFPTPASEMISRRDRNSYNMTMNYRHQVNEQRRKDYDVHIEQNPRLFSDENCFSRESSYLSQSSASQGSSTWLDRKECFNRGQSCQTVSTSNIITKSRHDRISKQSCPFDEEAASKSSLEGSDSQSTYARIQRESH